MSTEAMKLALEALNSFPHRHLTPFISNARTALREALAQPQQEPVAWMHKIDCDRDDRDDFMAYYKRTQGYCIPPYTSPPARPDRVRELECVIADLKAECQELRAKQPAQSLPFGVGGGLVAIKTLLSRDPCAHATVAIQMIDAILAEHPAQRKPLTDEQIASIVREAAKGSALKRNGSTSHCIARAVEAAHGIKENT